MQTLCLIISGHESSVTEGCFACGPLLACQGTMQHISEVECLVFLFEPRKCSDNSCRSRSPWSQRRLSSVVVVPWTLASAVRSPHIYVCFSSPHYQVRGADPHPQAQQPKYPTSSLTSQTLSHLSKWRVPSTRGQLPGIRSAFRCSMLCSCISCRRRHADHAHVARPYSATVKRPISQKLTRPTSATISSLKPASAHASSKAPMWLSAGGGTRNQTSASKSRMHSSSSPHAASSGAGGAGRQQNGVHAGGWQEGAVQHEDHR